MNDLRPALHADGALADNPAHLKSVPMTRLYRGFLPEHVDLSAFFPRPGDQGAQGSCVGWAVGYAARAYYAEWAEDRSVNDPRNIPSPAYIYNSIKAPGPCSTGSQISDALNLLENGAVSLRDDPYSDRSCRRPPERLSARATDFRIEKWQRVSTFDLDQVKSELYHKNPVIVRLHDSTRFQRLGRGQVYRHPGRYLDWHAITVVGYDERRQAFKVINSWGTNWASGGFGWIGYDAFRTEITNAYVMRVKPVHKPAPVPPAPPGPVVVLPHPVCSHLSVADSDGRRVISGFVGYKKDLAAIRLAAGGATVKVDWRPWPQCEALLVLHDAMASADAPKVTIRAPAARVLHAGDHMVFTIVTPPFPSYLHVAYFQADGSAVNLVQPGASEFKAYAPRSTVVLGDGAGGGDRFRVSAPFGHEMLVVLAARSPVFPKARPRSETQREFLTALRRALLYQRDPAAAGRDVVAAYDTVVTRDQEEINLDKKRTTP